MLCSKQYEIDDPSDLGVAHARLHEAGVVLDGPERHIEKEGRVRAAGELSARDASADQGVRLERTRRTTSLSETSASGRF